MSARDAMTAVRIGIDICATQGGMGCEFSPRNEVGLSQNCCMRCPSFEFPFKIPGGDDLSFATLKSELEIHFLSGKIESSVHRKHI